MATVEPLVSPRLTTLRQDLKAGNKAALDAFWQEVTRQGTPLIEPIMGDDRHVLVTFLWRAGDEIANIVVYSNFMHGDLAEDQLTRLLDTDLWYKTYKARNDVRTTYSFSPNDPQLLGGEAKTWEEQTATSQPDPLNRHPRRFLWGPKDEEAPPGAPKATERIWSILELPAAPPQPWSMPRSGVPAGKVELHRLPSTMLAPCSWLDPPLRDARRVWVYTPPGYTPDGEPYGLLLLFDGLDYLHRIHAPVILDNLLADNRTPPLVAVLFDSPDDVRSELGNSPIIAEFVAQELLPWVRRHYHITANPAHTIVGGLSAGGCAAAYMGLRHPELFGNVLSQSGAFWLWGMERAWVRSLQRALQRLGHDPGPLDGVFGRETVRALRAFQTDKGICVDGNPVGQPTKDAIEAALGEAWQPDIEVEHEWLARQFAASPRLPLRFYLDAGRLEVWPTPDDGPSLRLANRHMRTVFQAKGYPVHYAEFGGGHDWLCWQGTLADGLMALLGADRTEETE